MTATDEVRRMLDERGIEYSVHEDSWAKETYWIVNHNPYRFSERSEYGTCVLHNITPEQAIEATLGRGECRITSRFKCSECGHQYPTRNYEYYETCDGRTAYTPLGYYVLDCKKPNYCPNCGRKVVLQSR